MTRKERSWMYKRVDDGGRLRTEFVEGVNEFIGFALEHPICNDGDKIRCPCIRCKNKRYLDVDTVKVHLYKKGFTPRYFCWLSHGETVIGSSSSSIKSNPCRDMVVVDALGNNKDRSLFEEANSVDEEPNDEAKKLFDLLKAAEDPLYEGKVPISDRAKQIKETYENNLAQSQQSGTQTDPVGGRKKGKVPGLGTSADLFYERSSRCAGTSCGTCTPSIFAQLALRLAETDADRVALERERVELEKQRLAAETQKKDEYIAKLEKVLDRYHELFSQCNGPVPFTPPGNPRDPPSAGGSGACAF